MNLERMSDMHGILHQFIRDAATEIAAVKPDEVWRVLYDTDTYFLKRTETAHKIDDRLNRLETSSRLLDYLSHSGFPCPKPVPTRDGGFVWEEGGGFYQLASEISGTAAYGMENPTGTYQVGRCMGTFHTLQEESSDFTVEISDLTPVLISGLQRRAEELVAFGWDRRDLMEGIAEANCLAPQIWSQLAVLPAGWLHTDASAGNFHFDGPCLSGLIDFELVPGPYLLDLGMCFVTWTFPFDVETGHMSWDLESARALLQGYASTRSLKESELDNLKASFLLASVLWWIRQAPQQPGGLEYRFWTRHEIFRICQSLDNDDLRTMMLGDAAGT
jgi:Ser/Thr protein kinase RdoA (MazF antagonist)